MKDRREAQEYNKNYERDERLTNETLRTTKIYMKV